ncbi:hypothetical protein VCHA50P417_20475 [Vibrio chagasii]|nr:hypothetical protein VCHA50P417_20475 [Vibrio chagasii]
MDTVIIDIDESGSVIASVGSGLISNLGPKKIYLYMGSSSSGLGHPIDAGESFRYESIDDDLTCRVSKTGKCKLAHTPDNPAI